MRDFAKVKYYKIGDYALDPSIATEYSACFDLAYCGGHKLAVDGFDQYNKPFSRVLDIFKSLSLFPGERALVPTGLVFDIPTGYSMRIHPRSSTAYKLGLMLANGEGVIDSDYKQEVYMLMVNMSYNTIELQNNTRLCQGEIVPVVTTTLERTTEWPGRTSERDGGFGSTGV